MPCSTSCSRRTVPGAVAAGPVVPGSAPAELGPATAPRLPGGPGVLAAGRYGGPLRAALLRYKERGRRDLAGPLAELLAAPLQQLRAAGRIDWLVPGARPGRGGRPGPGR